MHPYFSYAKTWRRPLALAAWGLLATALVVGQIRFLPDQITLVLFGAAFGVQSLFYFFLALLAAGATIVYLTFKIGRTFCSCVCPYHQLLEWLRPQTSRPFRFLVAGAVCFLLSWSLGYFVGNEPFNSVPSVAATLFALVVFAILLIILFGAREQFCRRLCPYGMLQVLLHNDFTLRVVFQTPGCTNCRMCDGVCPMRVRVRKESSGYLCTNCTRCICSCRMELGVGQEVLCLSSPECPARVMEAPAS